jgi:PhnB protein
MADVKPIPDGHGGVTPHLVVDNATEAIEFYKKAFGAIELFRSPSPDGKKLMHASLRVRESLVYLCDDFPEWGGKSRNPKTLGTTTVTIHQYVEDCDDAIKRAEEAGAKVTMPAQETFWGDRYGTIEDPYGHSWSFATHVRDVTPEEMSEAAKKHFSNQ